MELTEQRQSRFENYLLKNGSVLLAYEAHQKQTDQELSKCLSELNCHIYHKLALKMHFTV